MEQNNVLVWHKSLNDSNPHLVRIKPLLKFDNFFCKFDRKIKFIRINHMKLYHENNSQIGELHIC